ncbi:hypothetical protein F5Y16DRAFT_422266 [Xylariaceae sp. FL0255]|nr:hypothetical protein F5Y16DRAFT_422266 [Xylariaceae sp. FL0255]
MAPHFEELEDAACNVIQIMKQMPELGHTKLAVIGGLALWHYLRDYRPTNKINFLTNISTSPSSVKKKLLDRPGSPFIQRQQILYYQSSSGWDIQVDISPEWLSPYLPQSALPLHEIPYGELPYISLTDLIVFKLDSSGLRSNPIKKDRDARDAAALINHEAAQCSSNPHITTDDAKTPSPSSSTSSFSLVKLTTLKPEINAPAPVPSEPVIQLSPRQEQIVEEALCDVNRCGSKDKGWWESQLGLSQRVKKNSDNKNLLSADGPGSRRNGSTSPNHSRSPSRPHSRSDPLPPPSSMDGRAAEDPDATWYYERLDRAHGGLCRRWNELTGGLYWGRNSNKKENTSACSPSSETIPPRPGLVRSSSYAGYEAQRRWWCNNGNGNGVSRREGPAHRFGIMTQPKTSISGIYASGVGGTPSAGIGGYPAVAVSSPPPITNMSAPAMKSKKGARARAKSNSLSGGSDSGYSSTGGGTGDGETFHYLVERDGCGPSPAEMKAAEAEEYFDPMLRGEPLGTVTEIMGESDEGNDGDDVGDRGEPLGLRRTVTFQL